MLVLDPLAIDLLEQLSQVKVDADALLLIDISPDFDVSFFAEKRGLSQQDVKAIIQSLAEKGLVEEKGSDVNGWSVVSLTSSGEFTVRVHHMGDGPSSIGQSPQLAEEAIAAVGTSVADIRDDVKWLKRAVRALLSDRNLAVPEDDEPDNEG